MFLIKIFISHLKKLYSCALLLFTVVLLSSCGDEGVIGHGDRGVADSDVEKSAVAGLAYAVSGVSCGEARCIQMMNLELMIAID